MKAIPWFFGLIVGLCLNSSAFALSCAKTFDVPTAESSLEDKQGFDAQTRERFGSAEIVAEAKVVGLGEIERSTWRSSQWVDVVVSRYLRAPLIKQIDDRYKITVAPGSARINDELLFFATAGRETTLRVVPAPPNEKRYWFAHNLCTNPVYHLNADKNNYLVQFARQLADDKLSPSRLRLSFYTNDPAVKARGEISVKIIAMDRANASRTINVTANGIYLDLSAGRYQLHWLEIPGSRAICFAQHSMPSCELDLVPGASVSVRVEYQPTH